MYFCAIVECSAHIDDAHTVNGKPNTVITALYSTPITHIATTAISRMFAIILFVCAFIVV